jgi:hypothetical protein
VVKRTETLVLSGWRGGLNAATDPTLLAPDELALADDIDLGPNGELIAAKGVVELAHASHPHAWVWVKAFKPTDSTDWGLVLVTEDSMHSTTRARVEWSLDPNLTTFYDNATITSNGDLWVGNDYGFWPQAVVMNDAMYVTRAGQNSVVYEFLAPAGVNDVNQFARWPGNTTVTNQFPSAVALCVAYERVFAANICATSASTRTFKDRLFFSAPLLPLSWNSVNYIDIAPDENTEITGIFFFADQIIIFKESSIWGLSGSDFTDLDGLQLYKIADGVGCSAPGSIVDTGSVLIFLDPTQGIFAYDGSALNNIGLKVFNTIKGMSAVVAATQVNGWLYDNAYHVRVDLGSVAITYVYNLGLGAWTRHNMAPRKVTTWVDEGVVNARGVTTTTASVWQMYTGHDRPGSGYVMLNALTGWLSPASHSMIHRLDGLEVVLSVDERQVTTYLYRDLESASVTHFASKVWAINQSSDRPMFLRTQVANAFRWRSLAVRLRSPDVSSSAATNPLTVSEINLHYSTLPRKRGEQG